MSMDPRDTVDKAGLNTNQGMNTRSYLLIVVAGVLIVLGILVAVMLGSHHTSKPGVQTPPTSSGQSSPSPQ